LRVLVAMSGGVDSAVAAALLAEQGHDVVGFHMKMHDAASAGRAPLGGSPRANVAGRCCGDADALDARAVASAIGIPFYVADLRDAFRTAVMDDFAETFASGRTPNPCVRCNGMLKFRVLLSRAVAFGADRLATGHYARLVDGRLAAARDADKDQSYFLYQVPPAALARTLFPLGEIRKHEVREHAARLKLPVADKPDSQELCFVPDDDHAGFVRRHLARTERSLDGPGDIVGDDGTVLGRHEGVHAFTIGQRRGLGVALGRPAWVRAIDPISRRVFLTTDLARLGASGLEAHRAVFASPPSAGRVRVRVRHRGALAEGHLEVIDGDRFRVAFDAPVRAVAPGQAAVLYDGETVVGGGTITRALTDIAA
jgi:tRNA-specific 2-thiouridylase